MDQNLKRILQARLGSHARAAKSRGMRALVLAAGACAALLVVAPSAAAVDPSGGAMAPTDASVETNTGGSLGPANQPAPSPAPAAVPRTAPVTAPTSAATAPSTSPSVPAATSTASAAVVKPPVARRAGNAVEPTAGGGRNSAPLEPLPPSSGKAAAKPTATSSGPSLAMTGGEMATTLTLGVLFLTAGLLGAGFARRRRTLA